MSKEVKLTNLQVPKNPALERFDALKNAKPIDMKDYENMGEVEHHESIDSVAAKMIAKQEAARGVKIDAEESKSKINLGGIVDDRKDKKYWKR